MKVLILNDCESKNDKAIALLKAVCLGIQIQHEIKWINVQEQRMQPCTKCFKCLPYGECILSEDDAHKIGREIFTTDALVIGLDYSLKKLSPKFNTLFERCASAMSIHEKHRKDSPWRYGRPVVITSVKEKSNLVQKFSKILNRSYNSLLKTLSAGGFKLIENLELPPKNRYFPNKILIEKATFLGCQLFSIGCSRMKLFQSKDKHFHAFGNFLRKTFKELKA